MARWLCLAVLTVEGKQHRCVAVARHRDHRARVKLADGHEVTVLWVDLSAGMVPA